MTVTFERAILADIVKKRIRVIFEYDRGLVASIKTVPGAKFVPANKGGPAWSVPLDITSARCLRQVFGQELKLSTSLRAWGHQVVSKDRELRSLGEATDASLHRLPDHLPDLFDTLHPYQRAGVRFAATSQNPLIADHPGLGKTLETIGAVFEAGTDNGPSLVIAPLTSLDTVWLMELNKWQPHPVYVPSGGRAERLATIQEFENALAFGPAWLVVNPAMVRLSREKVSSFPALHRIEWANIIVDECVPEDTFISTPNGRVPIQLLSIGDVVFGYEGDRVIETKVMNVFSSPGSGKDLYGNGVLQTTGNHPWWTEECGYVEAMYLLRQRDGQQSILQQLLQSIVQKKLVKSKNDSSQQGPRIPRQRRLRKTIELKLLLARWWQWQRNQHPTESLGREAGLAYRSSCKNRGRRSSISLQDGYCQYSDQDGDRDRWRLPSEQEQSEGGQKERGLVPRTRMASLEIHKCSSVCRCRFGSEVNQVFNIETGTGNYFAEGVLIHNCHKNAVRNRNTSTAEGIYALKLRDDGKRIALSGTPIGGKPINLWGILHYLNPQVFSSKWRWAEQWLEITDNGFGKTIGSIKRCSDHHGSEFRPTACPGCDDIEEAFYEALRPYMLRRTKPEVLSELPNKIFIDVWCDMSPKQSDQYVAFAKDAEVRIDEQVLSATSILAEYTRLKQFASAYHDLRFGTEDSMKITPTSDSGKLVQLERLLEERGVFDPPDEQEGEPAQVVIFSQFSQLVDLVYDWLESKSVKVEKITGAVNKRGQRAEIQRSFQSGEVQVLVMTTTAGGVAITLDRADTVVFLDETWQPDDMEQASDRCHRASRIHQVTVYTLRTKNTIEEQIMNLCLDKDDVNKAILDRRRSGYRATINQAR